MLAPDLLPPSTPDFLGEVGLNLALSEGLWALVTPVKAIRVRKGLYNKEALTLLSGYNEFVS